MLTLLTGPDRLSGMHAVVETICREAKAGVSDQILIVPEQASFAAERMLCALGGDTISRFAEVLSFTRLATRVFSVCGGVSEEYLDEGGRLLCLYLTAEQVKTQIKYFASHLLRPEFLAQLGTAIEEFMTYCASPQQLLQAAAQMTGQQAQKLTELALLYESYLSVCKTGRADPVTRMTRLSQALLQEEYCAGKRFYLCGFSDFTGVQLEILDAILPQADVTVFLCAEARDDSVFTAGEQTVKTLSRMAARRNIEVTREKLTAQTDRPEALSFWLSHVLENGPERLELATPEVSIAQTKTCAQACELAAGVVQRLTAQGVRWRDIAVACTSDAYLQTLSPMLARAGISAYYAGTVDILQKPLLQAVLSAMQAANRFLPEDVLQYLKSGFSPLEMDACDRLEQYAYFWSIRGSQWLSEWTRHPDGFGQEWTDEANARLFELNVWREGAIAPLRTLHNAWLSGRTVSERLRAFRDFLEQTHFPENALEQTDALYRAGSTQAAQENEQLYDILITAMEQAEMVLGTQELELERFLQMFRMLLGRYKVGSIPATLDQVQVGSLDSMRSGEGDYLLVLGADDGALPALSEPESLLSDIERQKLSKLGVNLSPSSEPRLERELGRTQLALQSAKRSVLLISGSEQPSYLLARTKKILPGCETLDAKDISFVPDERSFAAAAIREDGNWPLSPAALQAKRELEEKLGFSFTGLSKQTVQGLYGKKLSLSASRLDKFAACRYSFFLRYGLKCEPWRQASFDAPVFGTFAHYVLECTVRDVMEQGGFQTVGESRVSEIAKTHMDTYEEQFMRLEAQDGGRTDYLFKRNREEVSKIVLNVAEELRTSRFVPCDEELAFAKDGKLPPVLVETPDGQAVLSGFVDRVDILDDGKSRYFRVIDYKTGRKDFDYTDLLCGQGLQMLLYLFAIERAKGGHIAAGRTPAGVLYVPGRMDMERLEPGGSEEELQKARQKNLVRKGLLLQDEAVLQAMEPGDSPKFLPYQVKKGELTGSLATREQFRLLEQFVSESLQGLAAQIFSGAVAPNPIVRGPSASSCKYCDFQSACHFDACPVDERWRKKVKAEEFWAELERRRQNG